MPDALKVVPSGVYRWRSLPMTSVLSQQIRRAAGHLHRYRFEYETMRRRLGYRPHLVWPRSFNEKIVRRKLRRPDPAWSVLADKVAVRSLIAERADASHLIETYLITSDARDIAFDDLPHRFVVKASHGSSWNLIVSDKTATSEAAVRARAAGWLERTYGGFTHETWYYPIPPRIIVERLLEDDEFGVPPVFKCWVFHGRLEYIQIDLDRSGRHTQIFYDRTWAPQPWYRVGPLDAGIPKPAVLGTLIDLAERLSGNLDFVRVDLYCLNGRDIRFGELTLAPGAGWDPFQPRDADFALGRLW